MTHYSKYFKVEYFWIYFDMYIMWGNKKKKQKYVEYLVGMQNLEHLVISL